MRVLEGHTRAVMTFDYSPSHNLLASGGAERDILLWYILILFYNFCCFCRQNYLLIFIFYLLGILGLVDH